MASPSKINKEFSFPFPPYPIQLDFMQSLYDTLNDSNIKVGLFESPTGTVLIARMQLSSYLLTYFLPLSLHKFFALDWRNDLILLNLRISSKHPSGKSLSLLCGSLKWLTEKLNDDSWYWLEDTQQDEGDEVDRFDNTDNQDTDQDPDWVTTQSQLHLRHEFFHRVKETKAKLDSLNQRIQAIRSNPKFRYMQSEREYGVDRDVKRRRIPWNGNVKPKNIDNASDDEFLVDEYTSDVEDGCGKSIKGSNNVGGGSNEETGLSKETLDLLRRFGDTADSENEFDSMPSKTRKPKIFRRKKDHRAAAIDSDSDSDAEVPKIYYASRTHSQLSQFINELKKTSYSYSPSMDIDIPFTETKGELQLENKTEDQSSDVSNSPPRDGVEGERSPRTYTIYTTSLGSRKTLCINQKLIDKSKGSLIKLNDYCIDLQKGSSKSKNKGKAAEDSCGCEYYRRDPVERANQLREFRDWSLASVRDIEELVTLGKELKVCPYYGTRKAIRVAHLVTLPYNLLLSKQSRESLDVRLKNNIVVIDEAHNIIETINSVYSISIDAKQIERAHSQTSSYLLRYQTRLKGSNTRYIRQLLLLLKGLHKYFRMTLQNIKTNKEKENRRNVLKGKDSGRPTIKDAENYCKMVEVNQFLNEIGVDHLNLFKLEKYLKESGLPKKLNGFVEKQEAMKQDNMDTNVSMSEKDEVFVPKNMSPIHNITEFFMALTNADKDGRVLVLPVGEAEDGGSNGQANPQLKYILLNPADRFREIVDEAKTVILAGGTMEPITDFTNYLFPYLPATQISRFSCGHVIPKENLLTASLGTGPSGKVEFNFTFENRNNPLLIEELGHAIVNLCNVIPDGIVVFLASYSYLDVVYERWSKVGILERLERKKKIFKEPKSSSSVETVLREYALTIESPSQRSPSQTGAILLSVVGGKMSEGINFSDRLGRGIVMVGLPFPNLGSPELKEKMKYIDSVAPKNSNASQEYYENLCMRAVNQSIGRAIRHKNDYASIILLDKRFVISSRIKNKLPTWISRDLKNAKSFGMLMGEVGKFFRSKKM
ncbi:helicase C-terminal domain-containing protein [Paraphysoderma sedebokerense]|nr:helicase C-terminal domain-containing protein [Paraphysoderma sedebokerense]